MIYQEAKYLNVINLSEIEDKYSFTTQEDVEWMVMSYSKGDYKVLK